MTAGLFSRDWYRVAELRPRLHRAVQVHRHRYRGERWYVLQNTVTGKYQRITAQAYALVGLMNGQRSLDQIWELACDRLGNDLPTHEQLLQLVSSLYQANFLMMDVTGDAAELLQRDERQRRQRWLAKLKSPLSVQIPLLDPERWLDRSAAVGRWLYSPWAAVLWCVAMAAALVLAGQHWDALTTNISDRVLAADNLLIVWLVYPLIKLVHELGHAYAIKRYGGTVHEMGIMFLVFLPVPYVDATASNAFASKYQRMLVGAAGILVELFIAALAMLVWVNAEPGLIRAFAYNIILVASVSTLLFNGNPLLRFDAYYVLADWLEMPNLASRSNQYWGQLFKRYLFGVREQRVLARDRRESAIFLAYGLASLIYRLMISVAIVLFVAQQYFVAGVILAIWSIVGVWLWPFLKLLWQVFQDQEIIGAPRRPMPMLVLVGSSLAALLFLLPLPLTTTSEGVVQLADRHLLIAEESCFVSQLKVASGQSVSEGDLLVECDSPTLRKDLAVVELQLQEARLNHRSAYADPVQIKIHDSEVVRLQSERAQLQHRIAALNIHSRTQGQVLIPDYRDLAGRYLRRGQLVGYVIQPGAARVRVMLPEADIHAVQHDVKRVELRYASDVQSDVTPGSWQVLPAASNQLVSPVLSQRGGGEIATTQAAEKPGASEVTVGNYFHVDLAAEPLDGIRVDERVFVRFHHAAEPLGYRLLRTVRRTFLQYFDV